MTDELKSYLDQSRESRHRLNTIARKMHKPLDFVQPIPEISDDFPELSPIRFKRFKESMNKDLQRLFLSEDAIIDTHKKQRSLSFAKRKVFSVYHVSKPMMKKLSILPPIKRMKEINVPERLLGGKYMENSLETSPTINSFQTPKRSFNTRYEVKKQLLIPILHRGSSKSLL